MKSSSEIKVFLGIAIVALVLVGVTVYATHIGDQPAKHPDPPTATRRDLSLCKLLVPPGSPMQGNPNAKFTLVEFGDYQCPTCRMSEPEIEKVVTQYGDRMRYIFHHVTIRPDHYYSPTLAKAVAAAAEQGKFWEMHKRVFTTKIDWDKMEPDDIRAKVKQIATELGLDQMRFTEYLQGQKGDDVAAAQNALANKAGVHNTPAFYLIKPGDVVTVYGMPKQAIDALKKPETWK